MRSVPEVSRALFRELDTAFYCFQCIAKRIVSLLNFSFFFLLSSFFQSATTNFVSTES